MDFLNGKIKQIYFKYLAAAFGMRADHFYLFHC